ncbi:M23 family metallopeptidase [Candidatus Thioglobus sp.]|jgi:lipoprotein NlpD|uniref:murein hydrolase activator EnvC family protein n=1 Tax=Candidatus Thioglobus sp. TaxID=2026721 RepID=UPI001DDD9601|nr:M23 family metallopeptidase [Candidatus Thioglobus sp.]MBT3276598.1 M23 family metallopeptidase [Candidatus Thioglobus sp.]MBT3447489.1 M23 family metallopeptidase [Candidatus Thioglobus sp.]MBT3744309.1 M23 family metallopeptidase [Candidatus Thioglobus sp.]MBT4000869.1 M23 family metallopeptidase [Candidatus Thioglobus sp.]MBT4182045.1 M23 family metallopeptidase [Candidatus Thioglobus sp.]
MLAKLLSVILLISLSGCYSTTPKRAVIVVEKSRHLENINQQRHSVEQPTQKARRITDQSAEKSAKQNKPKSVRQKSNKKSNTWQTPVNAKIAKSFSKKHQGLTFNTRQGQKIRAIRDGKVIYIGDKMKSHGTMIVVRHPLGFYSTYTQSQSLLVSEGDQVVKNQIIASTNNQLFYFEMKKFKQTINPLKYLK